MGDNTAELPTQNRSRDLGNGKNHILLNAFDMSTIGHMSPGQWKVRKKGGKNPPKNRRSPRNSKKNQKPRTSQGISMYSHMTDA